MSNDLVKFEFEGFGVRAIDKDGEPWFVAKDVCDVLGIVNSRDAVGRLDEDERNTVAITDGIHRGNPNVNIVSESGLYSLVLVSRKPEAHIFKKWITKEVIPSIRKTGSYSTPKWVLPTNFIEALEFLVVAEKEKLVLKEANEKMLPKVEVFDICMDKNSAMTFTEAAHYLNFDLVGQQGKKLSRISLAKILRAEDVLFMNGKGKSVARQEFVNQGYFTTKMVPVSTEYVDQNFPQLMITQKGLDWLSRFLVNQGHCYNTSKEN